MASLLPKQIRDRVDSHPVASKVYDYFVDGLFMIAGSLIYAVSVDVFTAPNEIAPGGVTGIATILYYLFKTPIGVMMFVLNLPLLMLGLKFISRQFMIKTIFCTVVSSFSVDIMAPFLPAYKGNMLLAALYGGVISGVGLALVFLRGATTGGTDVASRLLRIKFRHIPMGRMMMFVDTTVVLASAFVFNSVNSALYALITIFACSRVIDGILYGADNGRMILVISEKHHEIGQAIINEMDRGVTILKGKGFYTGQEREVLMCAVRQPEAAKLRSIVKTCDPNAFMIMCEAGEVIGEGFKPITKDD